MTTVFQQVGRYAIRSELGRGGMATVFLATDTETGSDVALKQVPIGRDREGREILEAEEWGAQLQAHFSDACDCVPKVFGSWRDGDYFYIAMEYVDGRNLSELLVDPLPAEQAIAIAIDLCRFLEAAHSFKVTIGGRDLTSLHHSDLKPRNVRITAAGKVKVLDFGIAKALSLSRKVTRNDFGSVPYLSPERLESNDIDAYTDLWALGVVLYEMIGGAQPFTAPDTRQLERRIVSRGAPPPLSGLCPPSLQAVVAKLLAPLRSERYPTATAIREDLQRCQSRERTQAEAEGWPKPIDDAPTTRTRSDQPAPQLDDERTRRTTSIPPPPVSTAKPSQPATRVVTPRRIRLLKSGLVALALLLVLNELAVGTSANQIARSVVTRQLPDLGDTWNRYDALNDRSFLRVGVMGLRRALIRRTVELSEHVMANYRNAVPTLRETQWLTMRAADLKALSLDPDDAQLKSAVRLCEGHLHRIAGDARKAKHDNAGARQEFTEAVTAFREAAQLRPNWPDPFLGLMRTFIYGLDDLDRGVDALRQAERFGYSSGNREIAQLADGYRARGDRLARSARTLRGLPQEQPSLEKAAESYRHSLELYGKVTDFAGGALNIRLAQRSLDQVEQRLQALALDTPGLELTPRL
jgi:eukaryotic-like serine/threonine-protein kinase